MWLLHSRPQYPQPRTTLWATLGYGVLVTFPVIVLFFPFSIVLSIIADTTGSLLLFALVQAFVGAAILQESFKFFVLTAFSCQRRRMAEPFDGVIYGVVASLGFATLENIAYVSEGDLLGAAIRALTSVPMHAALGAIMGYYIAQGVFNPDRRGRFLGLAWLLPVVLHGLYDFPLLFGALWSLPIAAVTLVVSLVWAIRLVRRVQSGQRRRSIAIWGELGSREGQFSSPHDITLDPAGNMLVADTLNSRIHKLSPEGDTVALWGTTGQKPGEFRSPRGLAINASGHIIVADTLNHRIQMLTDDGEYIRHWGEQGSRPGQFRSPGGIAVNAAGEILVADTGNHRIQRFDTNGELLAVWGSHGSEPGEFRAPVGIALDNEGWVYIADSGNHRVQKLSADGGPAQLWGEEGEEPGQFRNPSGIALDRSGRIYVADTWNNRVQELSASGEPIFQWGAAVTGQRGQFEDPRGIALDERSQVYVADTGNHCIQKMHPFSLLMTGAPASETEIEDEALA
jgi:DNA-binding beta-propeller fold protein YncE/RsiW-degrading membrane proteinase PrsW (M82 family)